MGRLAPWIHATIACPSSLTSDAQRLHTAWWRFDKRPVWSLWFRFPPKRRWDFHCPKGWVDADVFLSTRGQADGKVQYYADGISEKGRGLRLKKQSMREVRDAGMTAR